MICAECLLGVSEVHAGLGIGVQLVVDAGAVAHGTLDDDDGLGAIHIENGHARDRRATLARSGLVTSFAFYPATFACEVSVSIDWALLSV